MPTSTSSDATAATPDVPSWLAALAPASYQADAPPGFEYVVVDDAGTRLLRPVPRARSPTTVAVANAP